MGHILRVASELSLINCSKINCQCKWPPVRTPDSQAEARQWRGLKLNLEAHVIVPASCGLFKFNRRRAQAGPPGVPPRWSVATWCQALRRRAQCEFKLPTIARLPSAVVANPELEPEAQEPNCTYASKASAGPVCRLRLSLALAVVRGTGNETDPFGS
jgi:hypothetical protein